MSWHLHLNFFLISWDGVRLCSFGMSATIWPTVPVPKMDDRWRWGWSSHSNENREGKLKYLEKTCPSATLSTTNHTWPDLGSNPGHCSAKPATNCLSYGAALQHLMETYARMGVEPCHKDLSVCGAKPPGSTSKESVKEYHKTAWLLHHTGTINTDLIARSLRADNARL
jgi:hypothetical protein